MLMGSLMVLSGLPNIYASDGTALQLANSGSNTNLARTETSSLDSRQEDSSSSRNMELQDDATLITNMSESQLLSRINLRKLENASRVGNSNKVRVTVQDYVRSNDGSVQIPVGEGTQKEADLQAKLIRIEGLDTKAPQAICELFAVFSGIEHAEGNRVIVEENSRKAEAKVTGYELNDTALNAKPIVGVTLPTADSLITVEEPTVREAKIAYTQANPSFRRGGNIGGLEAIPGDNNHARQKYEKFERWQRPDGTIYERRTEDFETVTKPKPPAPAPQPPITVTIPRKKWCDGGFFGSSHWSWEGSQTVTVPAGQAIPKVATYGSGWCFLGFEY